MNRKVEFIESYIKVGNDYQWNDNHGELIRCKDCKHYHEDSYGEDEWIMCRRTNLYTDGEKYCAWAERMDGDRDEPTKRL